MVSFARRDEPIPIAKLVAIPTYAERFPNIPDDQWPAFVESIRTNGQREAIAVFKHRHNGQEVYGVVDGYQRFRALTELGADTVKADILSGSWMQLTEEQRLAFVDDRNKHRRHLTISEMVDKFRATAPTKPGKRAKPQNGAISADPAPFSAGSGHNGKTAEQAAKEAGFSSLRVAQEAAAIVEATVPEVHRALDAKRITKKKATALAKLPREEQAEALSTVAEPENDTTDCLKKDVPKGLTTIFGKITEFRSLMRAISDLKTKTEELATHAAGTCLNVQEITRLLDNARSQIRFSMPYTECHKCRRKVQKSCPACKGRGWVHEGMFRSSASDADKKWLESR